jgi:predicted nucleic acid-binding protein
MERYLIDTNVVSDYFSASFFTVSMQFMDTVFDSIPNLSVITQIELLCWKTGGTTEQKVKDFIDDSIVLNITSNVIAECVKLRKGKKIKLQMPSSPPLPLLTDIPLLRIMKRIFLIFLS